MTKNDIITALERIPGDPEIEVKFIARDGSDCEGVIDRINEIPSPEIVIIEK